MPTSVRKIKNRTKNQSISVLLANETKRIRLIFLCGAVVFLCLGFYLSLPAVSKEKTTEMKPVNAIVDENSFSSEPVKINEQLLKSPGVKDKKKIVPDRITIPLLGIDIAIKQSQVKNGYWEVFPDSAGWGTGSAYPEDNGNQVIFAHAREGLFLPLKNSKIGQYVYIFAKEKWYQYQISNIKEVTPQTLEVIAPTTEPILTLYTCSGFSDSKRLIVTAKKVT
jgi:LPXTG-site transpeptidase (sortase) family protein